MNWSWQNLVGGQNEAPYIERDSLKVWGAYPRNERSVRE